MQRTAETIIASFTRRVSDREAIPADEWLQAAQFLVVLIGDESNKLFEAEQAYSKESLKWVDLGRTNSEAEKRAKVSPEYLAFRKQASFVKQIEEFIRLAKKQAALSQAQEFGKGNL